MERFLKLFVEALARQGRLVRIRAQEQLRLGIVASQRPAGDEAHRGKGEAHCRLGGEGVRQGVGAGIL